MSELFDNAWVMTTLMSALFVAVLVTLRVCSERDLNPLTPLLVLCGLMLAPWYVDGVSLEIPADLPAAKSPRGPLIFFAPLVVIAILVGYRYTVRNRTPLFLWCAVAGLTLYPLVVEPLGDFFVAVAYPTNLDIVAEPFGRPMGWLAIMFYGAGIPLVVTGAYELAKRAPANRLVLIAAVVSVLEVPMEMFFSQMNWMHYYGNHATVLGVPLYCIAQNGGMFAVTTWVLAIMLPSIRGWRWALVPFALAAALPGMAIVATWPAYLAIAFGASAPVGWTAAVVATVLNAALVVACAYSRPVARLREDFLRAQASVKVPVGVSR